MSLRVLESSWRQVAPLVLQNRPLHRRVAVHRLVFLRVRRRRNCPPRHIHLSLTLRFLPPHHRHRWSGAASWRRIFAGKREPTSARTPRSEGFSHLGPLLGIY